MLAAIKRSLATITVVGGLAGWPPDAAAQASQNGSDGEHDTAWSFESGSRVTLFPASDVFPVYVADPHRATNALLFSFFPEAGIPGAGTRRNRLSAGGRFGMFRFDGGGRRARSWQISLDAGIDALFDAKNGDDAIGWDGNYGLTVTTASSGPWSFKIALAHTSAHVGDEYEDRLARHRINYTREELAIGIALKPAPHWRTYGEVGHSYYLGGDGQAPWRVQQGVEYEAAPTLFGGRFAWYGAVDLSAMQERAWRIDRAFQGGIVAHPGGRSYRFVVEYYSGRPTVSEFFLTSEASVTIGIRIDL